MRLRTWPDKQPIKVYVLADRSNIHEAFAKQILSIFPYQLRRTWDRQTFSGTSQTPNEVQSEAALLEAVATQPGAIGYATRASVDDRVRILKVE